MAPVSQDWRIAQRNEGRLRSIFAPQGREQSRLWPLTRTPGFGAVDELTRAGGGEPVGDQHEAAFVPVGGFDAHAHRVEQQILIAIGKRAGMEGGDGAIEGLSDLGDRAGTDGVVEQRCQDGADLAGAETAEEDAADERVDVRGPLLIVSEHGGPEAALAGARDAQIRDGSPRGDQTPLVHTVAIAPAGIMAGIASRVEIVDQFIVHAILEEELDGTQGVLGDIPPEVLGVLDPSPQIGYREIGQCWHTGHGRILLSLAGCWMGGTPFLLETLREERHESTQTTVHYRAPTFG